MVVICSICNGSLALPPLKVRLETTEGGQQDMEQSKYEPHAIAPMCGHLFHSSCLADWFAKTGEHKCPVCSCKLPADPLTKIYLSTGPDTGNSDSIVTGEGPKDPSSCSGIPQSPSDLPPIISSTARTEPQLPLQTFAEEPILMPLQISETTINGVRTVVYRFSMGSDSESADANRLIEPRSTPNGQKRREIRGRSRSRGHHSTTSRQENPDRSRSPHHRCHNCSTLEKIQILMMKEMADLKKLVTEQKAVILSLEQSLKLSSAMSANSKDSLPMTMTLVDQNSNVM